MAIIINESSSAFHYFFHIEAAGTKLPGFILIKASIRNSLPILGNRHFWTYMNV